MAKVISDAQTPFDDFLEAIEQWKGLRITQELWTGRFGEDEGEVGEFLAVEEAAREGIVSRLHAQLDRTLSTSWNGNQTKIVLRDSYSSFL